MPKQKEMEHNRSKNLIQIEEALEKTSKFRLIFIA